MCVKVLKEELKFVIFSVKNLNVNDAILKTHNTNNTKIIHCTVYVKADCAWGKRTKCENLSKIIILRILSTPA